jgi:hypothetical protein
MPSRKVSPPLWLKGRGGQGWGIPKNTTVIRGCHSFITYGGPRVLPALHTRYDSPANSTDNPLSRTLDDADLPLTNG